MQPAMFELLEGEEISLQVGNRHNYTFAQAITYCMWFQFTSSGHKTYVIFIQNTCCIGVIYLMFLCIQLTFQPMSAKYYKHEIFMVCDNCQVKQFTIQGKYTMRRLPFFLGFNVFKFML
jgi:hypothetical protein